MASIIRGRSHESTVCFRRNGRPRGRIRRMWRRERRYAGHAATGRLVSSPLTVASGLQIKYSRRCRRSRDGDGTRRCGVRERAGRDKVVRVWDTNGDNVADSVAHGRGWAARAGGTRVPQGLSLHRERGRRRARAARLARDTRGLRGAGEHAAPRWRTLHAHDRVRRRQRDVRDGGIVVQPVRRDGLRACRGRALQRGWLEWARVLARAAQRGRTRGRAVHAQALGIAERA